MPDDYTPRVGDPCIECRAGIDWLLSPPQKCLVCNGTGTVVNGEHVPRAGHQCTDCKGGVDHRHTPPRKCLECNGTGTVVSDDERSRLKLEHMLGMELPVNITGKVGRLMADEVAAEHRKELAARETAFYAERGIRAKGDDKYLLFHQDATAEESPERYKDGSVDYAPKIGAPCNECRGGIDWLQSPPQKCLVCGGTGMVVSDEERAQIRWTRIKGMELPTTIIDSPEYVLLKFNEATTAVADPQPAAVLTPYQRQLEEALALEQERKERYGPEIYAMRKRHDDWD